MNNNDKELLLCRILSGKTTFHYNNDKYILYSPNLDTKYESLLLYNSIINEEKYHDWIREDDIPNTMIGLGLWHPKTDKLIKDLEKELDDLKVELFKNFMTSSKTKTIRTKIKNKKETINKFHYTKQQFSTNTLEGYASSIKNEYIICNTLYKNDKLVFGQDNNYKSYTLFNNLVQQIDSLLITSELFKIVARSDIWRSYWNSCKYNQLFDSAATLLTDEQRALTNITKMYENIYEHPECPDDAIIDDDDALDGWMIIQKRKHDKDKKQAQFDASNPSVKNAGEVFVLANKEDIENITDLNSYESKIAIKQKNAYLQEHGSAKDSEMPDVKMKIKQEIFDLKRKGK